MAKKTETANPLDSIQSKQFSHKSKTGTWKDGFERAPWGKPSDLTHPLVPHVGKKEPNSSSCPLTYTHAHNIYTIQMKKWIFKKKKKSTTGQWHGSEGKVLAPRPNILNSISDGNNSSDKLSPPLTNCLWSPGMYHATLGWPQPRVHTQRKRHTFIIVRKQAWLDGTCL